MQRKNIPTEGSFGEEFGYSRAVRVGRDIHVSGTCAQAPDDKSDAYTQTISALGIIKKAIENAEASLSSVVRTVVYITGTEHAEGVTRAHGEIFGEIKPASSLVVVASLLRPHHVVEIEAYAVVE